MIIFESAQVPTYDQHGNRFMLSTRSSITQRIAGNCWRNGAFPYWSLYLSSYFPSASSQSESLGTDTPLAQISGSCYCDHQSRLWCPSNLGGTSRLARTLEGNEKRYQYTLMEREKLIEKSGGMQINACEDFSDGTLADGGKWVCGLDRVLQNRPNPIIHSLNEKTPSKVSWVSNYGFDSNATLDVASNGHGEKSMLRTDLLRSRIQFNYYSISDPTATKYRSLQSVMREFGHDWIDILKYSQVELKGSELPPPGYYRR
ncbi:hypothetical protein B0H13DRAFT_1899083 [Mycena leptocephala]|nr:hypothetical protein B0H13DRAFT_1899083 [Mycena leptocephala]